MQPTDVDQLNQILQILGTPDDETLRRIGSDRALLYIRSLPITPKVPFSKLYPKASPLALDLLERLLQFDPALRMTVEEALAHPYLEAYHDPEDEPSSSKIFDFAFEAVANMGEIKTMISREVMEFKAERLAAERNATMTRNVTLPVPTRDQIPYMERDDRDEGGFVRLDYQSSNGV